MMTPDRWNKIDELLDVAMELPLERRASYLDEACAGDEELQGEVESLLLAHEKSGTFIETTPAKGLAAAFVKSFQFSPQEMIGRTLGHYRIEALLGAGGMGEVYRARDSKLDRNVAIKVLPKHLSAHPDALARFEREAKAIAALPHPNILAIHDFGRESGVTYAVTELLEGETLRQRIERSTMGAKAEISWREVVKIAAAVAEGLAAAHARGIIHRDIKPENIFLTTDGVVKVLDFGIARVKKAVVRNAETLISKGSSETKPGTLMGTIGYMSPEQVRGDSADAPSDIFSLGCVMAEMLTGERPFARDSAAETMAAILRDEPLSNAISQEVPVELERIILRCLEKSPEDRFQSARDLALDVRALLTSTSGSFRSLSGATSAVSESIRARQLSAGTSRPQKQWLIYGVLTAAILLAAVGGWLWFRAAKPLPNSVAVLPFFNASGKAETDYLSEGIPESITNSLAVLPQLHVMGWSTVRHKAQGQTALDPRRFGQELNVYAVVTGKITQRDNELVITAEMINAKDGSHLWGERYRLKLDDATTLHMEIARKISDSLQVTLTRAQQKQLSTKHATNTAAYQNYLQGRYFLNRRNDGDKDQPLLKAIEYFNQAISLDRNFALAYAGLADAWVLRDVDYLNSLPEGRAAARKAISLDSSLAEPHAALAFAAQMTWEWAEAEAGFRRAIALNPGYATAHHWYAEHLTTQGRFDDALDEIQKAYAIDPLSVPINTDWGLYLFDARRYDEAIRQLRRVLEFDPGNTQALSFLANTFEKKQDYSQAVKTYLDLMKIQDKSPTDIEAIRQAFAQEGISGYWRKKLAAAETALKTDNVSAPIRAAYLYAALGNRDRAMEMLEQAYKNRHFVLGYLKVDPRYDNLRDDPRFADLLKRVGF